MGLRVGGSIGPLFGSVRLGVPREAKSLGRGLVGLMGTTGFAVLIVFVLVSSLISWVTGVPVELIMSILAVIIGIALAAAIIAGAVLFANHLRTQIRTLPRGRARREAKAQAWFAAIFLYVFGVWGVSAAVAALFDVGASTAALVIVRVTLVGLVGFWLRLLVRWVKRRNTMNDSTSPDVASTPELHSDVAETQPLRARLADVNAAAREERVFVRHQRRSRKALQQIIRADLKSGRVVPPYAMEAQVKPLTSLRDYRRMNEHQRQTARLQYEVL